VYEDSARVGTPTATRQIPVSELLAQHRGEQAPAHPIWEPPTANETTDAVPVIRDDVDDYATRVIPVVDDEEPEQAPVDLDPSTEQISVDDRPSGEIYIRELLRREGKLPREQRRRQVPKIAAAAAGVAALCGAVAASIVHIQSADAPHSDAAGPGVPLTVVDDGGPHGQALDAPLTPRTGSDQVTNDNTSSSSGTTAPSTQNKVRVAPYVTATQKVQKVPGATSASTNSTPTSTDAPSPSNAPTGTTSSPAPTTPTTPPASPPDNTSNSTPPSSGDSTPPPASHPSTGLLGGLLDPITGLLGG
jgi:hypothetical protein